MKDVPESQDDVDAIHAYRVLAHSEVQAFLQRIAENVLDVSVDMYKNRSLITHALHHLLVHERLMSLSDKRKAGGYIYPVYGTGDLAGISLGEIEKTERSQRKRVDLNNGLKASNLNMILGPLGYRPAWYPPAFLDLMNNFGVERGDVAHGTGEVGANQWPTGSAEEQRIRQLLPGLESIDRYQAKLLLPNR